MEKRRHRRRRGREEQARLAAEYLSSGVGLSAFARQMGVARATVTRWVKEAGGRRTAGQRLLPVVVTPGGTTAATEHVEVALPDGTALRMPATVDPLRLEALVAALRRAC